MTTISERLRANQDKVGSLVVGACRSLYRSRTWSTYDLEQSLDDTWNLGRGLDCCYDRPSIGLNYALWYHARRTQDVLRLMLASWQRHPPAAILDLGAGTGATAWALALAIDAGLPVGRVRLLALDGSPPMLHAAEHMWGWLQREPTMRDAAACVDVEFTCRSWTQPGAVAESPDIVASFLFDDSDHSRVSEVSKALLRVAEHYASPRIHLVSSSTKRQLLAIATASLSERGWIDVRGARTPELWSGPVVGLDELRREVLASTTSPLPWQRAMPSFSRANEHPYVATLERGVPTGLLNVGTTSAFVLDEHQDVAAQPDDRMTVVVGPAGSGKSRVLVERLARLLERDPGQRRDVLVTTFNKQLVRQLARWFDERNRSGFVRHTSGEGDIRYADPLAPQHRRLRFLNWDKVPSRLFGESTRGLSTPPFDEVLRRRVEALERDLSWQLSDAARRNLEPPFLAAELRRVIWGLGVTTRPEFANVQRTGRRRQLPPEHRELVWEVLMGPGHPVLFDHLRMRTRAAVPTQTFTHVLIDECQDFTPADFTLAASLVEDTRRLWVFGDKVQAMQLGPAYRRPARLAGRDGQRREWTASFELAASYRLPLRIAEAISPLAQKILDRDQPLYDVDDEPIDAVGLQAVTSAVLGVRPIVVAGSQQQVLDQIGEVLAAYAPLIELAAPDNRVVTLAEGDRWLTPELLAAKVPPGATARQESMRAIKGLERPVVIWSTRCQLDSHESTDEWIYTILSRTTGLLIIALSAESSPDATRAVGSLRRDRLLPWTQAASDALDACFSAAEA